VATKDTKFSITATINSYIFTGNKYLLKIPNHILGYLLTAKLIRKFHVKFEDIPMQSKSEPILEVRELSVEFRTSEGNFLAVDGLSWALQREETLGIVGESGSGKSVSALSVLGLVPSPPGRTVRGEIKYQGLDLSKISESKLRKVRGNEISMIFQDPMTSLNPVLTIGKQLTEVYKLHKGLSRRDAKQSVMTILNKVGIPNPEQRIAEYPHQLSGGMRQRVMIAMALACGPNVLLADEPTTALDVTIQAQIMVLMKNLQSEFGMSILLISHDLGLIAENCDEVLVMYAGQVMEKAPVRDLFEQPRHPYTIGLLGSIPTLRMDAEETRVEKLNTIPGVVDPPLRRPRGCVFSNRCSERKEICNEKQPELQNLGHNQFVRCWLFSDT
jgi:oligopeptide/dipeptide ABC transporter ATP-binding protein